MRGTGEGETNRHFTRGKFAAACHFQYYICTYIRVLSRDMCTHIVARMGLRTRVYVRVCSILLKIINPLRNACELG